MMSIFILIGAYRYYAGLAERFGKTKWHYGLLAIGIYIGFQVMFLFGYGMYEAFAHPESLNDNNYTSFSVVNIISWVFAIAAVYGVYKLLENKLTKENLKKPTLEIDKIGIKDDI